MLNISAAVKKAVAKVKAEASILEGEAENIIHPIEAAVTEALTEAKTGFDADVKVIATDAKTAVTNAVAAAKAAIPGLAADGQKALDQVIADLAAALATHGL